MKTKIGLLEKARLKPRCGDGPTGSCHQTVNYLGSPATYAGTLAFGEDWGVFHPRHDRCDQIYSHKYAARIASLAIQGHPDMLLAREGGREHFGLPGLYNVLIRGHW